MKRSIVSKKLMMHFSKEVFVGHGLRLASAPPLRKGGRKQITTAVTCLLLALLVSIAIPLFAQQSSTASERIAKSTIQGVVAVSSPQGASTVLEGISVVLNSESFGGKPLSTLTDSRGHFQFDQLAAGAYRLEIQAGGFESFTKTVVLRTNELRVEDVHLELEKVVQKVEVKDRAGVVPVEGSAQPPATLNSRQFVDLPLAQEKFKEALPLVPGVVRTHDGKLNFKGSSEDQGMLLVNSVETVDPVTGGFSIPVPVDDIQEVNVYKGPYDSQYGGFSGGLTTIALKPPPGQWDYSVMDFLPGLRGKNGHLVGVSDYTPRMFLGGPIIKDKLNFSEALTYEVRKSTIRGLPWPNDETKTQGFNSLTSFQAILSPRHLLTVNFNGFSHRQQFANINSLVPQTASSDLSNRGFSVGGNDSFQFNSGVLLTTIFQYTRFDSNAHGQGPEDMLVTPNGWGGNFFNRWDRTANEYETLSVFQFPSKEWEGEHQLRLGLDFTHRSYTGHNMSHPIQLLREDGSLAERIDFVGPGLLSDKETDVAGFVQDHWAFNDHLAFDFGGRLLHQSLGRSATFSPRGGLVYSLGTSYKTVVRAGAGLFYGPVPLLASNFTDNPARVLTYFDESGSPLGPSISLRNAYLRTLSDGNFALGGHGVINSPRNFTSNVEVDRELSANLLLRVSYLYSRTQDLLIQTPYIGLAGATAVMGLTPAGGSHYHEYEATLHYMAGERSQLNLSYIHSRARGNLNTLNEINVPFEDPVIRPDVTSVLNSDVPNRLVTWGVFRLPWNLTASPVFDVHSGLPYSNVDVLQNYVGEPNASRFPTFLSIDLKIYRTFRLPLPFLKNRQVRLGLYTLNMTNHSNPRDVYGNIASPYFGDFAGLQHRVNGFVIDVVN